MPKLTRKQLEKLVRGYLTARGRTVEVTPRAQDVGVDFIAVDPESGRRTLAQVKYTGGKLLAASEMMKAGWQLSSAREYLDASEAILFSDGFATDWGAELASKSGLVIVDGSALAKLAASPAPARRQPTPAEQRMEDEVAANIESERATTREEELIKQLDSLPCGDEQWRDYEELGVDLLNVSSYLNSRYHAFRPSHTMGSIAVTQYIRLDMDTRSGTH